MGKPPCGSPMMLVKLVDIWRGPVGRWVGVPARGMRKHMTGLDLELERGSHIGQIYEGFGEQKQVILPFFREGLRNGEHCLLVANSASYDDWCLEFQAYGIDVNREVESGALKMVTGAQFRGAGRIAGDADWSLHPVVSADDVCHWEATANLVFEGEPVRVICQYDRERYSPEMIHAVLRTHRSVVYRGHHYRCNPNFEGARILENEPHLNGSNANARTVEEALGRLTS
jgi:hypothetical protein